MPATPAVEVSQCSFSYGKTVALRDVSFTAPQGSVFGLLGPNGSGKTTLFRILSTLLAPDSGRVLLFGVDVSQEPVEARRQVGVVFQSQSLDSRLSVRENLEHQGHMHGLRGANLARRIDEVLDNVGIADRAYDRVAKLSGGLRRRADLAKGLLHRPKLLLLDEPSTGVDPVARIRFWHHLRELQRREGVTVLLTTHLLDEADRCDRLAILDQGRLVREGSPAGLKEEVGSQTITLETGDPTEVAAALGEEFGVRDALVSGSEVRFQSGNGTQWSKRLLEHFGTRIESVKVSRPSLEDVFLRHTGHGFEMEGQPWDASPRSTS